MRETHQKGEVERQVLEGERGQLSEALARVRQNIFFKKNQNSKITITICL